MLEYFHGLSHRRVLVALDGCSCGAGGLAAFLCTPQQSRGANPIPALAYYYIWYDTASWNRPKTTYPLLGRYSSDDVRRHAPPRRARAGGGAGRFHRQLEVDAETEPAPGRPRPHAPRPRLQAGDHLPGAQLLPQPAPSRACRLRHQALRAQVRLGSAVQSRGQAGRDLVGHMEVQTEQVRWVAKQCGRACCCSPPRSPSPAIAGSSGSSTETPTTGRRSTLSARRATRRSCRTCRPRSTTGGLWIAPAAPGFDARTIGGTRVVDRRGGRTLRQEWNTALASSPDAVGLISWNEFSESSEVEPTLAFGAEYLHLVKAIVGGRFTVKGDFDSSDTPPKQFGYAVPLFIGIGAVLFTGFAAFVWRRELKKALGRVA